jgi:hypothetical protein
MGHPGVFQGDPYPDKPIPAMVGTGFQVGTGFTLNQPLMTDLVASIRNDTGCGYYHRFCQTDCIGLGMVSRIGHCTQTAPFTHVVLRYAQVLGAGIYR